MNMIIYLYDDLAKRVYLLQLLHHNNLVPTQALLVGELPSVYPPT
jgi:hypothetical protein